MKKFSHENHFCEEKKKEARRFFPLYLTQPAQHESEEEKNFIQSVAVMRREREKLRLGRQVRYSVNIARKVDKQIEIKIVCDFMKLQSSSHKKIPLKKNGKVNLTLCSYKGIWLHVCTLLRRESICYQIIAPTDERQTANSEKKCS